jgi:type III restriction enzyme
LKDEFAEALSKGENGMQLTINKPITERPVAFPQETIFTYDASAKSQEIMDKNVYRGYRVSAEQRSTSEKLFERFCENSTKIKWFYKNGDKGSEYLSIVYADNLGKQKSFYPYYIVGTIDDSIWVVEAKGGFTKTGESDDIDEYTSKKFAVLKAYASKYAETRNLKGGIIRQEKQSTELCICTDVYSDDIKSSSWRLLKTVM